LLPLGYLGLELVLILLADIVDRYALGHVDPTICHIVLYLNLYIHIICLLALLIPRLVTPPIYLLI
jgi:hypothetical protein